MDLPTLVAIGVCLLGLVAAYPLVRNKRGLATITLLDSELAIQTKAREAQEERCRAEVASLRSRHDREIGEVRGQLAVVTDSFAETIAKRVVDVLREGGHV
jgi:hypothetical protein